MTLTLTTTVGSSCYYIGIKLASIKYSKGSWLGPEMGWGSGGGSAALRLIHGPTCNVTQKSNSLKI